MSQEESPPRFSPAEERTLSAVLERIIPPSGDGRLPGAGELGLGGSIQQALRETPEQMTRIVQGLASLDDIARRRGSEDFSALAAPEQLEVLREVETAHPDFLPGLIFRAYTGYYQSPRVLEGLGLEPRPPHPEGYEMDPGDFGLLEAVRRRSKLYREC
jgi:hypothetical protein